MNDLSADELADVHDDELTALIDKHCPVVKVGPLRCRKGRLAPWLDAECRITRMSRRKSRMNAGTALQTIKDG